MKYLILTVVSVVALSTLLVGCGPKPATDADSGAQLTVDELANLEDFHAWKLPIPESQHPFKTIQLVMMSADGTAVLKFGTGYTDGPLDTTNILFGFHYENGGIVGKFKTQGTNHAGMTWNMNFSNAPTEHPRSWAGARLRWEGDRAVLAKFWKGDSRDAWTNDSTLAVELVK